MKFFFYLLVFFNIITQSYSNTIFYLTKIPNLIIHDLTSSNGIKYLKAEKSFQVGIVNSNVQCDVANKKDIDNTFKTIKDNFDIYDKNFLNKVNLKYIVLCKNLKVSNIKTAGVPNHIVKTLIIDVKSDPKYFERSLHHELFHMIDDSFDNLFSKLSNYKYWMLSYNDSSYPSRKDMLDILSKYSNNINIPVTLILIKKAVVNEIKKIFLNLTSSSL